MPNFRYRALTENGEIVSGLITAPTSAEVARRIDYLRLVPVDPIVEEGSARASRLSFKFEQRVRSEDVTIFTLDLALLLKAGARLDRALELLAADADIGRLRSTDCCYSIEHSRRRKFGRRSRPPPCPVSTDVCGAGTGRRGLGNAGKNIYRFWPTIAAVPRRCDARSPMRCVILRFCCSLRPVCWSFS